MIISIITINLNNAVGLEKTIISIRDQALKCIELIVIDGNSTDSSKRILTKYSDLISKLVIEKDEGIYDAMNKGLQYANGAFVLFLNSGDVFNNNQSLNYFVGKQLVPNKIYFGRARNTYNYQTCYYTPNKKVSSKNVKNWLDRHTPCHQAILFPREFYKHNRYDLRLKIAADIDYKRRAILNYECVFIDEIVIDFELGGFSTVPRSTKLINQIISDSVFIERKSKRLTIRKKFYLIFSNYGKYIIYKILGQNLYFNFLNKIMNN